MELFDVLIFGAVFYYIVKAVRRAASGQRDKRPPGSIATEDGEKLSWAERTQRALEGAMEWEEKQRRLQDEADIHAEIEAMRAAEREAASPWRHTRDEQRRLLEEAEREVRRVKLPVSTIVPTETESLSPGGAAPSLSNALAGVAAMLDQRAASGHLQRSDDPFQPPAPRTEAPVARRDPTAVTRPVSAVTKATGIEVEAQRIEDPSPAHSHRTTPSLTDLPGIGRLTPLQRAIVYGEIFGRPVALGGGAIDDLLD